MKEINNVLGYISRTVLFDLIPLDTLLHYIIGLMLTLVLLKFFKDNLIKALFTLLVIQILKEYYDSFRLSATLLESVKDTAATMIHPLFLIVVRKIKKTPLTGNQEYYR